MSRRGSMSSVPEIGLVMALNSDGAGVVRDTTNSVAKTAFVAGALPGERVRFTRIRRHRRHDEGTLLEILESSNDRVVPRCAHFGVCGGCSLQHLAPIAQLAVKHTELVETLARIGKVVPNYWLEPMQGPVWQYRRRARLGVKYVIKRKELLVGFRERQKPYIAALDRCEVLEAPVDALIEPLKNLISALQARDFIAQIEVAVADNVTVLVMRNLVELSDLDRLAMANFERTQSVRIYIQPGGVDSVQPLQGELAQLSYRLPKFHLEFKFRPNDFIQVNASMNELLVDKALELLQVGLDDRVLDLFCGLGNFSLPLARRAREVVGIEGEPSLVARAQANAQHNEIHNVRFHVANLASPDAALAGVIPSMAGGFSHILLDPPRTGALEILPRLAALGAQKIVYVSCHPSTLARDLAVLVHVHGYQLQAAGVIDMFPHTNHMESIALLERRA